MEEQSESLTTLLDAATSWARDDVDDADRAELHALVERARGVAPGAVQARAELADRFVSPLQFGTAGLRGAMAAGPNRMNRAVVIGAAAGLGAYLRTALASAPGSRAPRVVVGFDARHRSADFARDTAAVLTAQGAQVLVMPSALPTPVLSFAVRHLDADAGVMVTASHNPAADNGYKVYLGGRVVTDAGQGAQIVPPYDVLIAEQIAAAGPASGVPRADSGWTTLDASIVDDYVAAVLALRDDAPRTVKVVTTSLHGVGGQVLARVLDEAGFKDVVPVAEQRDPDPEFPTVVFPNPEERGATDLALAVARDVGADLVIANDPDADRCAVAVPDARHGTAQDDSSSVPQGWRMLHGDEVGALLGDDVAARLAGTFDADGERPVLANSIVSSRLLAAIATHYGVAHATTLTGFKWIARTPALVFGYEEALGYCVDPAQVRDKDGISAALLVAQLANRLKAQGRTLVDRLDDLARRHGLYLTDQLSVRFEDLSGIPAAMTRVRAHPPTRLAGSQVVDVLDLAAGADGLPPTDGVQLLCQDGTRVIVRPSGTEPKVKCYLEVVRDVAADATYDDLSDIRTQARAALATLKHDIANALGL